MTPDPRTVALEYMKAFEAKDIEKASSLLHTEGLYKGPMKALPTAETFVKELRVFMGITKSVRIKKVFSDDTDACIIWDYETIVPSIPITSIAEWFKIEDGKIRETHLHFNAAPFIAAIEKGEIAEALKSSQKS